MKLLGFLITITFSSTSFSGTGHGHSHGGHSHSHGEAISITKSRVIGEYQIKRLIKAKKINGSWNNAIFDKSIKKKFGSKTEWVVSFNNSKGVKGKKIFIFLKLSGDFVAANFTGK